MNAAQRSIAPRLKHRRHAVASTPACGTREPELASPKCDRLQDTVCKIRRITCDKTKPICQQCRKARIACGGYDKALLTSKTLDIVTSPRSTSTPSTRRFSAEEVPFFDFFQHALTEDSTGYECTDFWSRVVLCEGMSSDCVRHTVLAIASLSAGISESLVSGHPMGRTSALIPWTAKTVMNTRHRVALQY